MIFIRFFLVIFFLFFFQLPNAYSEKIVYINIEKIMKGSKAGKAIIDKINKTNESNLKKFKQIEEELQKEEKDLISKKNVLSEEEFQKKFNSLKKKINDYRSLRQKTIGDITKKRLNASKEFFSKINPILSDYAAENNISFILQKKNILMGKTELDITNDIMKIVDKEISKIKF